VSAAAKKAPAKKHPARAWPGPLRWPQSSLASSAELSGARWTSDFLVPPGICLHRRVLRARPYLETTAWTAPELLLSDVATDVEVVTRELGLRDEMRERLRRRTRPMTSASS
jgi:hypothetical protein